MENLLTIREAAEVLRLSPATIRGWVFRRKINHVKVGGSIRFQQSDLLKMIQAGAARGEAKKGGHQ